MPACLRVLMVMFMASFLAFSGYARAQDWPEQPVRLLVGFGGGSSPDILARTLAEPLSAVLGKPVVVENRPGAGGNIAANAVSKAKDNHTIGIVINGNLTSSPLLYPDLPYDAQTGFTYISLLATAPLILVAQADAPAGKDFLSQARQAGDRWNYGSVGVGSISHLGMEQLKSRLPGMAAVQIPYTGGNPAVVGALISRELHMALMPPAVALAQINSGKISAIGVTSREPSALAPGIMPLAQAGVSDFNLEVWNALVGPATLSVAARERLSAAVMEVLRDEVLRDRLLGQGWQAVGSSAQAMRERVSEEAATLGAIIRAQDIRID